MGTSDESGTAMHWDTARNPGVFTQWLYSAIVQSLYLPYTNRPYTAIAFKIAEWLYSAIVYASDKPLGGPSCRAPHCQPYGESLLKL